MSISIMLDLETWGKRPGCDIRSIGAVVFDPEFGTIGGITPDEILSGNSDAFEGWFYVATDQKIFDIDEASGIYNVDYFWMGEGYTKYPLTRDPDTVKWWSEQSEAAQGAFNNPVELHEALGQFATWFTDFDSDIKLWANDPHFDVSILQAAFHTVGLDEPWHYRAPRSMKTVTDLAGLTRDDYRDYGDAHNALHDAIAQAMTVCKAYQRLGLTR